MVCARVRVQDARGESVVCFGFRSCVCCEPCRDPHGRSSDTRDVCRHETCVGLHVFLTRAPSPVRTERDWLVLPPTWLQCGPTALELQTAGCDLQ